VSNDTADVIVAASTVHTMAMDAAPVAVLAIRDGKIAATAGPDDRRDLTAAWRGPDTVKIDDPGIVVRPPSSTRTIT
jgi:predicted amidohydrolase YtcJ